MFSCPAYHGSCERDEPRSTSPQENRTINPALWTTVISWVDQITLCGKYENCDRTSTWQEQSGSIDVQPNDASLPPLTISMTVRDVDERLMQGQSIYLTFNEKGEFGTIQRWFAEFTPGGHFVTRAPDSYKLNQLPDVVAEKIIMIPYVSPEERDAYRRSHQLAFEEALKVIMLYSQKGNKNSPILPSPDS